MLSEHKSIASPMVSPIGNSPEPGLLLSAINVSAMSAINVSALGDTNKSGVSNFAPNDVTNPEEKDSAIDVDETL